MGHTLLLLLGCVASAAFAQVAWVHGTPRSLVTSIGGVAAPGQNNLPILCDSVASIQGFSQRVFLTFVAGPDLDPDFPRCTNHASNLFLDVGANTNEDSLDNDDDSELLLAAEPFLSDRATGAILAGGKGHAAGLMRPYRETMPGRLQCAQLALQRIQRLYPDTEYQQCLLRNPVSANGMNAKNAALAVSSAGQRSIEVNVQQARKMFDSSLDLIDERDEKDVSQDADTLVAEWEESNDDDDDNNDDQDHEAEEAEEEEEQGEETSSTNTYTDLLIAHESESELAAANEDDSESDDEDSMFITSQKGATIVITAQKGAPLDPRWANQLGHCPQYRRATAAWIQAMKDAHHIRSCISEIEKKKYHDPTKGAAKEPVIPALVPFPKLMHPPKSVHLFGRKKFAPRENIQSVLHDTVVENAKSEFRRWMNFWAQNYAGVGSKLLRNPKADPFYVFTKRRKSKVWRKPEKPRTDKYEPEPGFEFYPEDAASRTRVRPGKIINAADRKKRLRRKNKLPRN